MSNEHGWRVDDRVTVCPTGREIDRVYGTVTDVDPPGLRPGVRVQLDVPVNGVTICFATHDELTLVKRGQERCTIGAGGLLTQCLQPGRARSYGVTCDEHHAEFTAWAAAKEQGQQSETTEGGGS